MLVCKLMHVGVSFVVCLAVVALTLFITLHGVVGCTSSRSSKLRYSYCSDVDAFTPS